MFFRSKKVFALFLFLLPSRFLQAEAPFQDEEKTTWLDEMVVVASREQDEVMRVPGNVTIITEETIKKSPSKHVTELLRTESGLHVTNTSGSTPTGIVVEARGFNNGGGNGGRTLVLIDGRKANQADTSSPDWATIPLGNIKRIEIIRGPATAIYGDSSMAAVILIITKKGKGKPTLDVGFDTGSYDRFGQSATAQGAMDKFTYYLFGSHAEEDGYRSSSRFRYQNWTARFTQQVSPELELSLKTGYHTDTRKFPGTLTAAEVAQVGRRGSITNDDVRETDQLNIDFGADYSPTEEDQFSFLFYFNDDQSNSLTTVPNAGTTAIDDDGDDLSLTFRYTSTRPIIEKENQLTIGLDFLQEDLETISFNNFPNPPFPFIQRQNTDFERKFVGLYLHNQFSVTERILLDLGVRYDVGDFNFSQTNNNQITNTVTTTGGKEKFNRWSPKASITTLITDQISTYFSYSKSFRFPNRDELTGFFGITPALKPERGENFEIGLKAHFAPKFNGSISLYHLTVEGEILFQPADVGAFTFGQNRNFEEILHQGIELHLDTSILPRTNLFFNYTYVDTEIEKGDLKGRELPITPRHAGNLGATFDLGWGFRLWTQGRFVGRRFLANDLANVQDKLPSFAVWDARIDYTHQINQWKLTFFTGLHNILNKEYNEFGGVGGFPFGSRIGVNPSPEFNFVSGIGVVYTF